MSRELENLLQDIERNINKVSKNNTMPSVIKEFKGKLSRKDIFNNPLSNRDKILTILNNYRFSKFNVDNMKPNVLVIFNDREYVCTIKEFNYDDSRHKYADRINKSGFYIWEMKDSYTVGEIVEHTSIRDFLANRLTIDISQSAIDKMCDQYDIEISCGLLTERIYSTPLDKVDDPYSDTVFDAAGRMFRKIF
jgi:hypothetical protein